MLDFAQCILIEGLRESRGRKREYHANRPATPLERMQKTRLTKAEYRKQHIAILDMETDPFNKDELQVIEPFAACLYSHNFEPIIIWDEDLSGFVEKVINAIASLPDEYTIYAHNGGKFDYMFLVHKLRGKVNFKGRGIMSAKIGPHELRDSFHIIPEKLASYHKEAFDYEKMKKGNRNKHRREIIDYLISDCQYLLEIVQGFIDKFGLKISIGQAAIMELRKHYKVGTIGENTDATLRQYFYGGRVECLAGRGHFVGDYKMYDVNSMYPFAMANFQHPISSDYTKRLKGDITEKTIFLELSCRNFGALVKRTDNNETTATESYGRFYTTIWEYEAALELGLIDRVKIHSYIDNAERSDFSKFVHPLYEARLLTKAQLKILPENSAEYLTVKKDDIFTKLLLNNAYGKFAQNPRRYKESYITDAGSEPPDGYDCIIPAFECDHYSIWQRPSPNRRFNNVGTAASITGAARSILLRAIANSYDPIYCDTDSLICRGLNNTKLDDKELGAWSLEQEFSEVIVTGKKQYAGKVRSDDALQKPKYKLRSKGVTGLIWDSYLKMLDDEILAIVNPAPTFTKTGAQFYMRRNIRATVAKGQKSRIMEKRIAVK